MIFRQAERLSHMLGHLTTVACQHHRLRHAQLFQLADSLTTVFLYFVVDDDVTSILTVNSHMDNRAYVVAVAPLGAHGLHHLRIAHCHQFVAHTGTDAVTGYLLYLAYLAAVRRLVGEGIAQGSADGVRREVLHVSSEVQQLRIES